MEPLKRLGRPPAKVDEELLASLLMDGWTKKDTAEELGVTVPTLNKRIVALQEKEGLILRYRALQSLELTAIQAKILESITPEKIHEATLRELVGAYKILKDKELVSEGRPSEIKGLIGYLVHLEKEESKPGLSDVLDAEIVARDPSEKELKEIEEDLSEEEDQDFGSPATTPLFNFDDLPSL